MLFRVLGPLEVHAAQVHALGVGKPATVLATLLQQPNAWVPIDQIAEATWPGPDRPMSAEANLKTYVWQLRRILGGDRIERNADAYRVRVGPGELDADQARELAAKARRPELPPHEARALVERALGLWRGRPYGGLEPAAATTAALLEVRLQLGEHLAELQLQLGEKDQAVGTLRSVTTEAPLRESAWAHLARALHAAGRRAEALEACRRAADVLSAELGVPPGPELLAAEREVLGTGRRARGGSYVCADPGARAVPIRRELPRDGRLIGRTSEVDALRRAATGPAPLLLVEGPAGIGKTALAVRAAHLLTPEYPDGQFFLSLRRPVGSLLDRLLRSLGVPENDRPADPDEQAARWRSELAGRRVLLVLDDARTRDQVWPLLPAGPGSLVLVTARGLDGHLDGAARLRLGPLSPTAASAVFAVIAGRTDEQAIHSCRGNPAALRAAAGAPTSLNRTAV